MDNPQWDELVTEVAEIISSSENIQKRLGRETLKVIELFGLEAVEDFANAVKENSGVTRSPNSLRNYAWVIRKTDELKLPEDISFHVCQLIAGQKNSQEWADKINKEGMSGPEVARLIMGTKPKQTFTCKYCGKENQI
jgi:hypothetical protein